MGKHKPSARGASNSSRGTATKIPTIKKADLSQMGSVTSAEPNRANDRIKEWTRRIYKMKKLLNQATGCCEQEPDDVAAESNTIDGRLTRLDYHVKCMATQIQLLMKNRRTGEPTSYECASTSTSDYSYVCASTSTDDNFSEPLPQKRSNRAARVPGRTQYLPFKDHNLFNNGQNFAEHLKITFNNADRPDICPYSLREELGSLAGRPVLNLTTSGDESFTIRVDTKLQSDAMFYTTSICQKTCSNIAHPTYSKSYGLIYVYDLPRDEGACSSSRCGSGGNKPQINSMG